jgi:hypothetical protein
MSKQFKPTPEQIQAAQTLFFAKAFHGTVKPIYEHLETMILATGMYHYHDRYFTEEYLSKRGECDQFPADRMMHNRKHIHMMAGLDEACQNPETDMGDAARFYRELDAQAKLVGFIHGQNAECKADNEVLNAERAFMDLCKSFTGVSADDVSGSLENWAKLVELLMGLFSPYIKKGITPELMAYQDARMITSRYYYEGPNRQRVNCDQIPANTYVLAGMQDEGDTGKLTVRTQEGLVPLIDGVNHKQPVWPDLAGQTFDGSRWYKQ